MASYFNYQKLTQALNYLAHQYSGNKVSRLKVMKLLWAADRYHIRKFGRLIGGDDYFAMPHGPVHSTGKRIADEDLWLEEYLKYSRAFVRKDDYALKAISDVDNSKLSETDIEALDFAYHSFGDVDKYILRDLTHKYPEWAKHEPSLESGRSSCEPIDPVDFFLDPDPEEVADDKFRMNSDLLADSKEIFEESQTISRVLQ
jgi:uncharacterized phage-associated protein